MPLTHGATQHTPSFAPAAAFAARLEPTSTAAAEARRLVAWHFAGELCDETLDDLLLAVSELVTNAVRHGRGKVELRMALDGAYVMGAVTDDGPGFDGPPPAHDPARIGGHGLYIVGRVAELWGMGERPTNVWFQIAAPR